MTTVHSVRSFLSSVLLRGVASGAVAIRGLVFLPIIAKNFGTTEYSIWSQIITTSALLFPVLSLGLESACVRYIAGEDREQARRSLTTVLLSILIVTTGLLAFAFEFREQLAVAVFGSADAVSYVPFLLLYVLATTIFQVLLGFYRAMNEVKIHSLFRLGQLIVDISVAVGLVVLLSGPLSWLLSGVIAVQILLALIVLGHQLLRGKFTAQIDARSFGKYLRYGVPLIPDSFLLWVLNFSDRFVVVHFMSLEAAGVYASAYRFGQMPRLLLSSLSFVLLPQISAMWERGERARVKLWIEHSIKYYLFAVIPAVLLLYHFGPVALEWLSTPEFAVSQLLFLYVSFGLLLVGVYELYVFVIYMNEKTWILPLTSVVAAGLNVGLNVWLVPIIGLEGAAAATVLSFGLQCLIVGVISQRLLKLHWDLPFLAKCLAAAGIMHGVLHFVDLLGGIAGAVVETALGLLVYLTATVLLRAWSWASIVELLQRLRRRT